MNSAMTVSEPPLYPFWPLAAALGVATKIFSLQLREGALAFSRRWHFSLLAIWAQTVPGLVEWGARGT